MHAAGTGGTAVVVDGQLHPSPAAVTALEWLEKNPPTGLFLPEMRTALSDPLTAYRKTGHIVKESSKVLVKVSGKHGLNGFSFNGPCGWSWDDEVPQAIQDTLSELCGDVSCLGETESVVVLDTAEITPNWVLAPEIGRFSARGMPVRVPAPGRFDALMEDFRNAYPGKLPTKAQDRFSLSKDKENAPRISTSGLISVKYLPSVEPPADAPWSRVIALPIEATQSHSGRIRPPGDLPAEQRVSWCVGLHKALVQRIGQGAPPSVTGHYEDGVSRPANRIALQYLPAQRAVATSVDEVDGPCGFFLVMLPRGLNPLEEDIVRAALQGIRQIRSPHGIAHITKATDPLRTDEFFAPIPPGHTRLWATSPAMVADIRPLRQRWSLSDSALVSLAFVYKDDLELPRQLRGDDRHRYLAEVMRQRGVTVKRTQRLPVDGAKYVHKLNASSVAQPYRALLSIDKGLLSAGLIAIGQSRHLGGGLLLPLDLPTDLIEVVTGGKE